MSDLLPCPFCGSPETEVVYEEEQQKMLRVRCAHCASGTAYFASETETAAAWNRRASGWVSVEERLPEGVRSVLLLFGPGETPVVGWLVSGRWHADTSLGADFLMDEAPTHWMPLPEPPEPAPTHTMRVRAAETEAELDTNPTYDSGVVPLPEPPA